MYKQTNIKQKMKQIHILPVMAIAALMAASCSQDEIMNEQVRTGAAIEFDTYLGRDVQTRASVMDRAALQASTAGFAVFGEMYPETGGDPEYILNNEKVAYNADNNCWVYDNVRYWIPGHVYTFYAYAPKSDDGAVYSNPWKGGIDHCIEVYEGTDYIATDKQVNQTDKLDNGTPKTAVGTVDMPFKHMLSRVGFAIKSNVDAEAGITLNSVSLNMGWSDSFMTMAYLTWQGLKPVISLAYPFPTEPQDSNGGLEYLPSPIEYTLTGSQFSSDVISSTEIVNNSDAYLMLIPQSYNEPTIQVTYTVGDMEQVVTKRLEAGVFESGKAYKYLITLNMDVIEIVVDSEVKDWETEQQTDFDFTE
jgi:hypothetical protein